MSTDEEIEDIGYKYAVIYKHNKVVAGDIFRRFETNFITVENTCYYGFPCYDTIEDANNELDRYNSCKQEKCKI